MNTELARDVLDALESPACVVDPDSRVLVVNTAWKAFSQDNGGADLGTGVGVRYLDACAAYEPPGQEGAAQVALGLIEVLSGTHDRYEHEYACHSPTQDRWFSVRITPAELATGRGAVIRHVDVTDRVRRHTLQDPLTGLANRVELARQLRQIGQPDTVRPGAGHPDTSDHQTADHQGDGPGLGQADTRMAGVVVVDLDQFAEINDSLGRDAADVVLREVAARLAGHVGPGDTAARTSADEFVILWRGVSCVDDVRARAEAVQQALTEPYDLEVARLSVSCSVGTATSQPGESGHDMLLEAREALRQARREGRGRLREGSGGLGRGAVADRRPETELARAIDSGEMVVHYQPVMDLRTSLPVGVEALVRWQHPERGLVLPDSFIPLAESSGLIVPLGAWVLQQACRDAVEGPFAGLEVAVNLSTRWLTMPGLVAQVQAQLTETGLSPDRLCLEVTESAMLVDEQAAGQALQALADLGVRIAIDDFGTGYSSLLYLRRFPVSVLKLDRAFVTGSPTDASDEAICASVVRLAAALGATCIAEGVETLEQLALLTAMGCDQAQGWLWSKAVPLDELTTALQECRQVGFPPPTVLTPPPQRRLPKDVLTLVLQLHEAGASLHTIAAALNRSGAANPAGVRWSARSVARYVAAS